MKPVTINIPTLEFVSELPYQTRRPSYKKEGYFYIMHYPGVKVVDFLQIQAKAISELPIAGADFDIEPFPLSRLTFEEKVLLANNQVRYFFELYHEGYISLTALASCGIDFIEELSKEEWFSCPASSESGNIEQVRDNVRALLGERGRQEVLVISQCLPHAWNQDVEPLDEKTEEEIPLLFAV